jgi:hypothetical protein
MEHVETSAINKMDHIINSISGIKNIREKLKDFNQRG